MRFNKASAYVFKHNDRWYKLSLRIDEPMLLLLEITSEKPISDSDLKDLKDVITREGFFSTQTTYSPKENETYVASNLSITMDDKVHTTTWADTSEGVPEGLKKIRDEIKKLIADKK